MHIQITNLYRITCDDTQAQINVYSDASCGSFDFVLITYTRQCEYMYLADDDPQKDRWYVL